MTESDAIAQVKLNTAPAHHPVVTDGELMQLLHRYADEAGEYSGDAIIRASADVWDLKVAKASDHHDISVNGLTFSAVQVKQNCEERARFYRRRIGVTVN